VILDDKPGPGLCSLDPSSGPAGTTVTALNGDNFGSDQGSGYVEYFDGNRVSETESWNDGRILAAVDESAKTGPVVVVTDDGYASNPLNFSVGDCREDASVCSSGTECCGDGTCGTSCGTERPVSHYAWTFSTGDIPATPRVAVFCGDRDDDGTYDGVSPGPWESWSAASEVCVNASVTATFTDTTGRAIVMESGSFDGNVLVQTCDNLDAKDPCANLDDRDDSNDGVVSGSVVATSADAFEWDPTDDFSPSTTYRVTLLSDGIRSADGAAMSADYSWEFTTATDTDPCEVGEVYVSPSTYTAVSKDEKVGYAASPIAEGDKCVPLQCDDYEWNWEVSDGSKAELAGDDLGRTDACENTVVALRETASGSPVDVEAGPEDVRGNPTDVGELTIDFTDPEVTSWTPSCDTACMNAGLRVEFSAEMDADDLVAGKTVTLYQCEDALCDNDKDEIEEFSGSYALSVSDDAQALSIAHDAFELGTWYRVVISGDVSSASGVALSESGSNWGTDANQSFSDDFSWTFKTKDSDVSCSIDRVEVSPSSASASVIGEQTAFEALAYGAPDDCSVSGQLLDATDYSWDAWTAEDSPNVSGTASDVAELIGDGSLLLSSALPDGCSSECLHTGADITSDEPVCGDGHVTYGEECDGGSRCSDECLNVGNPIACVGPITAGCCGNKIVDSGEECDDGNSSETDGCSSICLNNGSRRAGTTCGDGRVDQSATLGGEDCDDNDARSGDGCSSQCLFEGGATFTDAYATCGNGTIEDGEDCDDSNAKDGDGCSSKCLLEGAGACAFECVGGTDDGENCSGIGADCDGGICKAVHTPCCGDSVTDYDRDGRDDAEDCDEGDADNGDGCSSECLSEGSSVSFDEPSYCGDGDVGTGEECDVSSEAVFDIGNRSVSVIKATAQQDVLNGKAGAEITASSGGKTGTAELSLSCSCNSDASCGDESAYGCGAGSCCFARPELNDLYPAGGDDVCRNTSVYADFSELMDENSFDPSGDLSDPNLYLELISIGGEDADSSNCPADYVSLSFVGNRSGSWIARAWDWVVDSVRSWFGQGASAASYACFVPVTYTQTSSDSGSRVSLNLKDLLEPDATYRLVVVEDSDPSDAVDDGILSANLVGINGLGSGKESVTFTTSSNACELEKVGVSDLGISAALSDETLDPSVGYFTENGEVHALSAAAYTVRGGSEEEIGEIPGVYEWTWKWGSAVCDDASDSDCEENIVSVSDADSTSSTATAAGNSGRELAVATASFVPTNTFGETSGGVSGQVALVANVCDNPPSVGYPYTDSISNFSFFYCRDAGDASTTEDDLPELDAPVDVTSASTDIIQEVIFKVAGTADAIGVRVMRNESYL
jgi:cysteine-rich repeat protein